MVQWKTAGPSAEFVALADLSAVHSACRLCIKVATDAHVRAQDNRQCACQRPNATQHHVDLLVRERGQYHFQPVRFQLPCQAGQLRRSFTSAIVDHFQAIGFQPIWRDQRADFFHSSQQLRLHRVYSLADNTVKSALFGPNILESDEEFVKLFMQEWCHPFEVIFI
jgi:hypothetical protein